MTPSKISSSRKKKIKKLMSMMNKQNQRLIPIAPPLVEMMDLVTTNEEIDYLLQMGTGLFDYKQAAKASNMSDEQFQSFFDTLKRKGLVHIEFDSLGNEEYRLNAIAVGWYEAMMHYNMGKPVEKAFSKKFDEYFKFFHKLNLAPLRNIQNVALRPFVKPSQDAAIMDPAITGKSKRKTIPINTGVSSPETMVHPTYYVTDLIEEFGNKNAISVFPCVCRHSNNLLSSPCSHEMPKESCIAFGGMAKAWASWGYGRNISKEEAIDILKEVREKGAVHSVIHERDDYRLPAMAICNCCWDCCGILKPYNMGAIALKYKSSFIARIKDDANCKGCGTCAKYCPTMAMTLKEKKAVLKSDICIGCGQCAFQCRQNNIELLPNERMVFLPVLKKSEARVVA
ncbi:MAG: 4Fe-4S binding protein [Desulfobacterales bacterium]|jgi:Pyruvate/2-oxoacid:ferredoxin oxidoreductase delta subunit|nr:4Fe-4S binding protein [Desulfobacterales bacterium]